jgi:predicted GNAT family N-acyltransferase
MPFTLPEPAGPAAFEEALALRSVVFCDEQGVPRELERDAEDGWALHLVIRDGAGAVCATGRVLRRRSADDSLVALEAEHRPGDQARIGRMAVRADARRAGLGRQLLAALEAHARAAGLREAVLHAQSHARAFYERAGYAAQGPEFEEAGIPHLPMARCL